MFVINELALRPTRDSQTTSFRVEDFVVMGAHEVMALRLNYFYDISGPRITPSEIDSWGESSARVLEDYAELWQRLANR